MNFDRLFMNEIQILEINNFLQSYKRITDSKQKTLIFNTFYLFLANFIFRFRRGDDEENVMQEIVIDFNIAHNVGCKYEC